MCTRKAFSLGQEPGECPALCDNVILSFLEKVGKKNYAVMLVQMDNDSTLQIDWRGEPKLTGNGIAHDMDDYLVECGLRASVSHVRVLSDEWETVETRERICEDITVVTVHYYQIDVEVFFLRDKRPFPGTVRIQYPLHPGEAQV